MEDLVSCITGWFDLTDQEKQLIFDYIFVSNKSEDATAYSVDEMVVTKQICRNISRSMFDCAKTKDALVQIDSAIKQCVLENGGFIGFDILGIKLSEKLGWEEPVPDEVMRRFMEAFDFRLPPPVVRI